MSETTNKQEAPQTTPEKITSVEKTSRPKNPGRVAAGKRLAAISKEAKARRKQGREQAIRNEVREEAQEACEKEQTNTTASILVVCGAILSAVGGYYAYNRYTTGGE